MSDDANDIVSAGLAGHLARLWRYALVLSGNRDTAEDLVQATCVRALERSHQFQPDTKLDRWMESGRRPRICTICGESLRNPTASRG